MLWRARHLRRRRPVHTRTSRLSGPHAHPPLTAHTTQDGARSAPSKHRPPAQTARSPGRPANRLQDTPPLEGLQVGATQTVLSTGTACTRGVERSSLRLARSQSTYNPLDVRTLDLMPSCLEASMNRFDVRGHLFRSGRAEAEPSCSPSRRPTVRRSPWRWQPLLRRAQHPLLGMSSPHTHAHPVTLLTPDAVACDHRGGRHQVDRGHLTEAFNGVDVRFSDNDLAKCVSHPARLPIPLRLCSSHVRAQ